MIFTCNKVCHTITRCPDREGRYNQGNKEYKGKGKKMVLIVIPMKMMKKLFMLQ
jgi:hypothetical protein